MTHLCKHMVGHRVLQRQTLNNSYELNVALVLMQLEDNVQQQKYFRFFLLYSNMINILIYFLHNIFFKK
jgi:hypothetical protein